MRITCQVCTVYDATLTVKVGELMLDFCPACLPRLRTALKRAASDEQARRTVANLMREPATPPRGEGGR